MGARTRSAIKGRQEPSPKCQRGGRKREGSGRREGSGSAANTNVTAVAAQPNKRDGSGTARAALAPRRHRGAPR
eukprot:2801562-Prymnesium_polylepis.1